MEGLPDLSALPTWAQVLCYGVFAASAGVAIGVGRFGWLKGKRTPAGERQDSAQVAAVVVDSSVLKQINLTGEALTRTLDRTNDLIAQMITDQQVERDEADFNDRVKDEVDRQLREQRRRQRRATRPKPG